MFRDKTAPSSTEEEVQIDVSDVFFVIMVLFSWQTMLTLLMLNVIWRDSRYIIILEHDQLLMFACISCSFP